MSHKLANLDAIAESWFEDDPEIAQSIQRARGGDRAKLATYLLQSIIPRRRDRWTEIILRIALWMREAPAAADLCWRELAIVAKALADGRLDARDRIADHCGAHPRCNRAWRRAIELRAIAMASAVATQRCTRARIFKLAEAGRSNWRT